MKKGIVFLFTVVLSLVFTLSASAEDYSFSLSKYNAKLLNFKFHNPGSAKLVIDAQDGFVITQANTGAYDSDIFLTSKGVFDLSQIIGITSTEIKSRLFDNGTSSTTISSNGLNFTFSLNGNGSITVSANNLENTTGSHGGDIAIYMKADGEVHVYNVERLLPDPPEKVLSRNLGVPNDLIKEHGVSKVIDAMNKANSHNGNPISNPPPAGGGGSYDNPDNTIDTYDLSSSSALPLYLYGPKYQGTIKDSTLYVRLYHPSTSQPLNGLSLTLTVVKRGSSTANSQVVLLDQVSYSKQRGSYVYDFDPDNWMVDLDNLSTGGYDLFLDVGRIKRIKLEVTVGREGQVFTGQY